MAKKHGSKKKNRNSRKKNKNENKTNDNPQKSYKYLITLTPLEPYFFGGENSDIDKDGYYIKSEQFPSQTTLFGVLRFLGIRNPQLDYSIGEEDKKRIGEHSYRFSPKDDNYGQIKSISPLLLYRKSKKNGDNKGKNKDKGKNKNNLYIRMPFASYSTFLEGNIVPQLQTCTWLKNKKEWGLQEYEAKIGFNKAWCSGKDVVTDEELFGKTAVVGINKQQDLDAFFKKEKVMLKEVPIKNKKDANNENNRNSEAKEGNNKHETESYCFAFIAELTANDYFTDNKNKKKEGGYPYKKNKRGNQQNKNQEVSLVYLGQGKSLFSVEIKPYNNRYFLHNILDEQLFSKPKEGDPIMVSALSDIYFDENEIENLNEYVEFYGIETRTHREFYTERTEANKDRQVPTDKRKTLYNLIRAGSIFLVKKEKLEEFKAFIDKPNLKIAGFNQIITNE